MRDSNLNVLFAVALTKESNNLKFIDKLWQVNVIKSNKNNYTWTLKEVPTSAKNIKLITFINLIIAICLSWFLYTVVTKWNTNSHSFKFWLERLINEEKGIESIDPSEIWLILNNASIHKANIILEYIKSSKLKWVFLPLYCPKFAPIETTFAILKQKAWMSPNREIDLQSNKESL